MVEGRERLVDLPEDVLEAQMSMLDLILAMFPSPGEIEITGEATDLIARYSDRALEQGSIAIPSHLSFIIFVPIDDAARTIQLEVCVPLRTTDPAISDPPPFTYSVRQPPWLTRAEMIELSSSMPEGDVLGAIEYLQDPSTQFGTREKAQRDCNGSGNLQVISPQDDPLVRVFFYFPSLSTKEKRMDLVRYAAEYQLTGFVLAGKPGVLCLEGISSNIDAYMNYIKMHSWGDIPSHQKKVSERYREGDQETPIRRSFTDMTEITDLLGEKKGKRSNRGDMKALEAWMLEKGLADAFRKVIMQS